MEHTKGRTLTDVDNIWFTLLTCNSNPIHFNKDYAERNFAEPPFLGRLVVNALLVLSIVLGITVEDTSKNGIMLTLTDCKILKPTFAGDTLYAKSQVLDRRESESHPTMGIVTIKTW